MCSSTGVKTSFVIFWCDRKSEFREFGGAVGILRCQEKQLKKSNKKTGDQWELLSCDAHPDCSRPQHVPPFVNIPIQFAAAANQAHVQAGYKYALTSANTIMKTDICNCIYMVSQTQNKMDFQPNMAKWVLQHVRPIMVGEWHGFSHPSMMGPCLSLHMIEVFAVHAWNCLSLFPVTSFMLEKNVPSTCCTLENILKKRFLGFPAIHFHRNKSGIFSWAAYTKFYLTVKGSRSYSITWLWSDENFGNPHYI